MSVPWHSRWLQTHTFVTQSVSGWVSVCVCGRTCTRLCSNVFHDDEVEDIKQVTQEAASCSWDCSCNRGARGPLEHTSNQCQLFLNRQSVTSLTRLYAGEGGNRCFRVWDQTACWCVLMCADGMLTCADVAVRAFAVKTRARCPGAAIQWKTLHVHFSFASALKYL